MKTPLEIRLEEYQSILEALPRTPNNKAWIQCLFIVNATDSSNQSEYIKDMAKYFGVSHEIADKICNLLYPIPGGTLGEANN